MKIKALVSSIFFIAALFAGSAMAQQQSEEPTQAPGIRGGAAEGQRGVPTQYGTPRTDEDQQRGILGQDQSSEQLSQAGMHKADDLIGKNLVSQQGQELGEIQNLVISQSGQVEYIILSRGGTLGVGGNLVPVPWQAADLQVREDQVVAGITEDQLQNAPSFDSDNWAQIGSSDYEQEVHSYFGTEPGARQQNDFGISPDEPGAGLPARE